MDKQVVFSGMMSNNPKFNPDIVMENPYKEMLKQIGSCLRVEFIKALEGEIGTSPTRGYYINSCFSHCQTQEQAYWFGPNSPTLLNKTIAEAVGDWVLDRNQFR
ncbi:hypothetical protein HAX54_036486 [Datura stramonium]|uniref:Pectin acetylesterase n=1 Tax=Datura stramonium TaxID=4076 RepID=A0ABS8SGE5_DATST|nr:hypothetical protein [Datura stramonium]